MCDYFNPIDKAAIDAFARNVHGLGENWWTGKDGWEHPIIKKDDECNVIQISLSKLSITGSVDLTKLPPRLVALSLGHSKLSGHLDLTQLPSSLKVLGLRDNSFTTIKIGNLPSSLSYLYVNRNELRGVILKPASVKNFGATNNKELIVCKTREEYDRVITEMTACVRMLRAASSSRCNAEAAFKIYAVAQQTINFLVNNVCLE